jgi:hypothetical protein
MPAVGDTVTLPALSAVFSGKRLVGSAVGGSQILRDFPRFIRLSEAGGWISPRSCLGASSSTRSTTASTRSTGRRASAP